MHRFIFNDLEGGVFSVTVGELESGSGLSLAVPISARLLTSADSEGKTFTLEEILDDVGIGEG